MISKTSALFGVLVSAGVGFASPNTKAPAPPSITETASLNLQEGVNYQVIHFPRGSAKLSAAQKRQLKSLAEASRGDIDKVHVAVWSDQSFPKNEKKELPKAQQDLADKRSEAIQEYLAKELDLDGVETYSMAERSNWFARAFNTDEGELKSLFSEQGVPSHIDESEFGIVRAKGGSAKAVILIERKSEDETP